MKAEEVRGYSVGELKDKLAAEKEALNKLKLTSAVSELENPLQLRLKRRDIARLNTELRRKETAEA
jgi:large subunit ribosomal protein L29